MAITDFITISGFSSAAGLSDADLIPVVQQGRNLRASFGTMRAAIRTDISKVADSLQVKYDQQFSSLTTEVKGMQSQCNENYSNIMVLSARYQELDAAHTAYEKATDEALGKKVDTSAVGVTVCPLDANKRLTVSYFPEFLLPLTTWVRTGYFTGFQAAWGNRKTATQIGKGGGVVITDADNKIFKELMPEDYITLADLEGVVPFLKPGGLTSEDIAADYVHAHNAYASTGFGGLQALGSTKDSICKCNGLYLTAEQALTVYVQTAHYLPWEWSGSDKRTPLRTTIPTVKGKMPDGSLLPFPPLYGTHMEVAKLTVTDTQYPSVPTSGMMLESYTNTDVAMALTTMVGACHELTAIDDILEPESSNVAVQRNTPRLERLWLRNLGKDDRTEYTISIKGWHPDCIKFMLATRNKKGLNTYEPVTVKVHADVYAAIHPSGSDIPLAAWQGIAELAEKRNVTFAVATGVTATDPNPINDIWAGSRPTPQEGGEA